MNTCRALPLSALMLAVAAPVQAEFVGLMNGRSVARDALPDFSVEGGLVLGELEGDVDYQYFGARFNFRASPDLVVYGDVGNAELEFGSNGADGIGFGIGAFYFLDGVFTNSDFAVKGSYHTVELEGERGGEVDFDAIVVEAVVSGREGLGASGNIGWYANAGIHLLDLGDEDETEIGFGGGIVVPTASGEFYLGVDLIDELLFGGGFRYFTDN